MNPNRRRWYSWLCLCVAICFAGCSTRVPSTNVVCLPVQGFDKALGFSLIFLGELHGTSEAPAFAAELSCNLAKNGSSLVFAVEWPSDMQSLFDQFLDAPTAAHRRALLSHAFFSSSSPDGRSSEAMFTLVERLRDLRASGMKIQVALFDKPLERRVLNDEREQILATNLQMLHDGLPLGGKLVALTGNVHSRRVRGTPWNADFESAAYRLRHLRAVSFDMAHLGGTSWVCLASGDCGARPWLGNVDAESLHAIYALKIDSQSMTHDGSYFVGKITSSPPIRGD
jgi:hypothetical protein